MLIRPNIFNLSESIKTDSELSLRSGCSSHLIASSDSRPRGLNALIAGHGSTRTDLPPISRCSVAPDAQSDGISTRHGTGKLNVGLIHLRPAIRSVHYQLPRCYLAHRQTRPRSLVFAHLATIAFTHQLPVSAYDPYSASVGVILQHNYPIRPNSCNSCRADPTILPHPA